MEDLKRESSEQCDNGKDCSKMCFLDNPWLLPILMTNWVIMVCSSFSAARRGLSCLRCVRYSWTIARPTTFLKWLRERLPIIWMCLPSAPDALCQSKGQSKPFVKNYSYRMFSRGPARIWPNSVSKWAHLFQSLVVPLHLLEWIAS